MKCKIIGKNKSKLQSSTIFKQELEKEIEEYLNQGYNIKASNITCDGMYIYAYVVMVKE